MSFYVEAPLEDIEFTFDTNLLCFDGYANIYHDGFDGGDWHIKSFHGNIIYLVSNDFSLEGEYYSRDAVIDKNIPQARKLFDALEKAVLAYPYWVGEIESQIDEYMKEEDSYEEDY